MDMKSISRVSFESKLLKNKAFVSYTIAEFSMLTQQAKCHVPYKSENADKASPCIMTTLYKTQWSVF